MEGSINPRAQVRYKGRHATGKRPHREGAVGSTWSHRLRKWLRLERVVDRESDLYEEKVVKPDTGEVIHSRREPLSKHTDVGSAKRQSPNTEE